MKLRNNCFVVLFIVRLFLWDLTTADEALKLQFILGKYKVCVVVFICITNTNRSEIEVIVHKIQVWGICRSVAFDAIPSGP